MSRVILSFTCTVLVLFAPTDMLQAQGEVAGKTKVEKLYETAFTALVEGDRSRAYKLLTQLSAQYPGTLYGTMAAERIKGLEALRGDRIGFKPSDQSGRISAMVFGTLYGTWLGVGTALVSETGSDRALAAGMMIGAPVGLATTHLLTKDTELSRGQASLIKLGGLWGTWQGYGWRVASEGYTTQSLTTSAMAVGLAGIASSALVGRYVDLGQGDISLLNYSGLWGTWFAFCAALMAQVDDGNMVLRTMLVGGNLGLLTMAALTPEIEISPERARLINLGGLAGTLVATGVVGLATLNGGFENAVAPMGIIAAGGIIGLWSGVSQTKGYDNLARVVGWTRRFAPRGEEAKLRWMVPTLKMLSVVPDRANRSHPTPVSVEMGAKLVDIRF